MIIMFQVFEEINLWLCVVYPLNYSSFSIQYLLDFKMCYLHLLKWFLFRISGIFVLLVLMEVVLLHRCWKVLHDSQRQVSCHKLGTRYHRSNLGLEDVLTAVLILNSNPWHSYFFRSFWLGKDLRDQEEENIGIVRGRLLSLLLNLSKKVPRKLARFICYNYNY